MSDIVSIESVPYKDIASSESSNPPPRYSLVTSGLGIFHKTIAIRDDGVGDPKGALGLNILHSPSEPLVDFIFVHGLGGGSRKTWSKTTAVTHYWPQEWLPRDPAFKSVRVHSFGYDSDWVKGKDNCLNIHHFGKSLLGEMNTSPYLADIDLPIVLIGHSLGGLVIKKAYMLARQDAVYESLAKRFYAIHFLATPHRGSDSAKLLSDIMHVVYSSRAYVADLKRSSWAIQTINDEFRNYSADIDLWSFYETQKLTIGGVFSKLIVDPDSAVLGYRDEKQMPMNADHRSICKFDSIADPNYKIVRNALASTVDDILKIALTSKEKLRRSQSKDLERYLGVTENLEDDLSTTEDARMSGTCGWVLTKDTYLKWKASSPDARGILWINGKPAAGKSVLAGYVIGQLQRANVNCSYFFFKFGDKSKSTVSACLRWLAFQMACQNPQIRDRLLEMQKDDITFEHDNLRAIWRRLFLAGIFQVRFPQHYWVIDALDECVDSDSLFDPILTKLDQAIPLRILITSRETPQLVRNFITLGGHRYQSERISATDTLPDIKLLVEAKAKSLVVKDDEDRVALVEKILGKSQGSFLWTILVLNELSNSYSEKEANQVLDEVPRDMEALYRRTLELMSQGTRGKKVANAILSWVTCGRRPLTTKELEGALRLELKDKFYKLEETVVALCGQLVTIDKFGKIQMVHETAREFLLSEDLESEFAVNRKDAHTRIARVCLAYLIGDEMKPPRSGRQGSAIIATSKRTEFSLYAFEAFSYHLARADPLANDILILVDEFLKSNILSWIETIAWTRDLVPLIRASRNLRRYFVSRSIEHSTLGMEMRIINGWATDLIRIAAKFANALIMSPSAIYFLIPPFCPTESMIYKIAIPGRKPSVAGLSNNHWDDRLSCIDFHRRQTSAICHGDEFLAVGLLTGTVALYHAASCQEYKVLNHGEAVKFLQFKIKSNLMASCGLKTIRVWNIRSGELLYSFQAPQRPIYIEFDKNNLIAASHKNYLASWDLDADGAQLPDRPWSNSGESCGTPLRLTPRAISISVSHQMVAAAYVGQPITLWDLQENAYYGTCGNKLSDGQTSTHPVSALVFNPNINIGLLAACYLNGVLVLLDPFSDQELASLHADCHTLASSPDGRLLAGAAGFGTVQIYEFDTLRLLYQVKSSDLHIKQLAFSRDSLRFIDIRGSQCNIWEPAPLLRDLGGDGSSESTPSISIFEAVTPDSSVKISAIMLHTKGEILLCGKENGSVCLYDLNTGVQIRTLYSHKSLVHILIWWPQSNSIMSVDASNMIFTWKLQKTRQEGWVIEKKLFQSRLDCGKSIIQVFPGEAVDKFVISTRESDHLWNMNGDEEDTRTYSQSSGIRKWIQHQESPLHLICVELATARIYSWKDWSEVAAVSLNLDYIGLQIKRIIPYCSAHKKRILIELSELNGSAATRSIHVLDAAPFSIMNNDINESDDEATTITKDANEDKVMARTASDQHFNLQFAALSPFVAHIIGLGDTEKLVFLDTHSWICSANLEDLGNDSLAYNRHFFVPYDWFSGTRDVISVMNKSDVLFGRNDKVAIVKGGLGFTQKVEMKLKISYIANE